MRAKLARWGNSAAVRLPRPLLEQLGARPGSEFEAWVADGALHLRPIHDRVRHYRLADLLSRITPDNVPDFEDWPLVGAELIDGGNGKDD